MTHTDLMRHLQENCKFAGEALDKEFPVQETLQEHCSLLSDTTAGAVQTGPDDTHADKQVPQIARAHIFTQVSVTVINLE